MSLLTGPEIKRQRDLGVIVIDPFDEAKLNPNSYNLTLAQRLLIYDGDGEPLDMRANNKSREISIPEGGFVLGPGVLYLGATVERAGSDFFAPMIEGRSSAARLGLTVHQGAGFGDCGFKSNWVLELTVVHALRIYAGISIAQISFTTVLGERVLYKGKYAAQSGPVASQIWRELKDEKKEG